MRGSELGEHLGELDREAATVFFALSCAFHCVYVNDRCAIFITLHQIIFDFSLDDSLCLGDDLLLDLVSRYRFADERLLGGHLFEELGLPHGH